MKNPPPSPEWLSAQKATERYVISGITGRKKLSEFRTTMISELVATGRISEKDAMTAVDKTLVGMRKPKSGKSALYANPVAFEIAGFLERDKAPPPPSESWKSANQLRWGFLGGNVKFTRQMEEIRDATTQSLMEAGLSLEDAAVIVDKTVRGCGDRQLSLRGVEERGGPGRDHGSLGLCDAVLGVEVGPAPQLEAGPDRCTKSMGLRTALPPRFNTWV